MIRSREREREGNGNDAPRCDDDDDASRAASTTIAIASGSSIIHIPCTPPMAWVDKGRAERGEGLVSSHDPWMFDDS